MRSSKTVRLGLSRTFRALRIFKTKIIRMEPSTSDEPVLSQILGELIDSAGGKHTSAELVDKEVVALYFGGKWSVPWYAQAFCTNFFPFPFPFPSFLPCLFPVL